MKKNKPLHKDLIEEYREKPVRQFLQIDAFKKQQSNHLFEHDKDGHVLTAGLTFDLRATDFPVRVQIHKNADKKAVVEMLVKIIIWLERDWTSLINDQRSSEKKGESVGN